MKYLNFFGKQLALISLGCDHYGQSISEATALQQLDFYFQQGGNLLDTAHIYGQEKEGGISSSEQILGKWLQANNLHSKLTIASKGCHPYRENMHRSRINEKDMMLDISQSLDLLKTDTLDLWFFHRDNPSMGPDEIIDLGNLLLDKKLVKHLGVSNWRTDRIDAANTWAKAHGRTPFTISEIQWSLAHCTPETWGDDTLVCMTEEQRQWYEKQNMPVMCFAPQAKGLFSKLLAGRQETLSATAKRRFLTKENLELAPKVEALSHRLKATPAAVAMAYLTSQKNPTIAIAGSSRLEQITQTLGGADLTLTEEDFAFLRS